MHWDEPHHSLGHCHSEYGKCEASFDLAGKLIAGNLPKRQWRLVQTWAELHAKELQVDWELAVQEKLLNQIDPLR